MKEDEHKKACQLVVDVLGLQVSTEFRGGLGAKSVRKGNAAVLGAELRGRRYMNCIYIKSSWMDLFLYKILLDGLVFI